MVNKRIIDAYREGRIIPRRRYARPLRFVGVGILIMIVVIFLLYRFLVH